MNRQLDESRARPHALRVPLGRPGRDGASTLRRAAGGLGENRG